MKKNKILLILLAFIIIILLSSKVEANSGTYSIDEVNMDVVLQKDGSLKINEKLTYKFNGSFNGIYITIPYGINDNKYDKIRAQTSLINDSFYNAVSYKIDSVYVGNNKYQQAYSAVNGERGVYTIENDYSKKVDKIKVYSPTSNAIKTFTISYTLNNLAVKHNDIGEIYYNFIGGDWDKSIKKVNININLPNNSNRDNLYAFAHGPSNGVVKIEDKNNINLYAENVGKKNYIAGRILFDKSNIPNSNKVSNKTALDSIMQEEKAIYKEVNKKYEFNNKLLIFAIVLLVYWLILMLIFERDRKYTVGSNDEEMFEKYNPLIAGCLQGNRNVLPRDIIAVILDLINKKYLNLRIEPHIEKEDSILEKVKYGKEKRKYDYYISINKESDYKPDEIETYILDWVMIKTNLNLIDRLEEIPKTEIASQKFEKLDEKAMEELNQLGANKATVPWIIKALNNVIFVIGIVLSLINIKNAISIVNEGFLPIIIYFLMIAAPALLFLMIIPIKIYYYTKKSVNKLVQKINGQKITITTISIILIFTFIMVITMIFSKNQIALVTELLIGVSTLIILTDNLMTKNDPIITEDYSRLNALKYKIENYSMMQDKDVNQVVLWEKYLAYAVSFGIANKISKYIKPMLENENISSMINDNIMSQYIFNDYDYFIMNVKSISELRTNDMISNINDAMGSFSGGDGGRWQFLWRWRLFRRWWCRPAVVAPSKRNDICHFFFLLNMIQ